MDKYSKTPTIADIISKHYNTVIESKLKTKWY